MSLKSVSNVNGDRCVRVFTCREHFYVMCFSQLTYRESFRGIESCLTALSSKLYHNWERQTPEEIQKWKEKLANSEGDIIN